MNIIGIYAIPVIIALAGVFILFSKNNLFDEFLAGGKEGAQTCVKLLPSLVMLICATRMFSASGALDAICDGIGIFTRRLGIPDSVIPVILMRPISGSAATAMINNLFSIDRSRQFCRALCLHSNGFFRHHHLHARNVLWRCGHKKNALRIACFFHSFRVLHGFISNNNRGIFSLKI